MNRAEILEIERALETLKTLYKKSCKMIYGTLYLAFINPDRAENKALDMAIAALEKQIPKKIAGLHDDRCPCCNYPVILEKYCPNCGQKLYREDNK